MSTVIRCLGCCDAKVGAVFFAARKEMAQRLDDRSAHEKMLFSQSSLSDQKLMMGDILTKYDLKLECCRNTVMTTVLMDDLIKGAPAFIGVKKP